jgi:hypothetical protein
LASETSPRQDVPCRNRRALSQTKFCKAPRLHAAPLGLGGGGAIPRGAASAVSHRRTCVGDAASAAQRCRVSGAAWDAGAAAEAAGRLARHWVPLRHLGGEPVTGIR